MATNSEILSRVLCIMQQLVREVESFEFHPDSIERLSEILHFGETLYGHLERIASSGLIDRSVPSLVREILLIVRDICEHGAVNSRCRAVQTTGRRGRPRFLITEESLSYLLENGFTVPDVSRMLGVSVSTVRRRMAELDIRISDMYTVMSDVELDRIVKEIKEYYPHLGSRMLQGQLNLRGLYIQRCRIRDSVRRIDPVGSVLRWFNTVQRRTYSVPHSQWLWHIDGNHKLIRLVSL